MHHLGTPELVIILVIAMLLFGVGKLPELGSALGQSVRDFRRAMAEAEEDDDDSQA